MGKAKKAIGKAEKTAGKVKKTVREEGTHKRHRINS